MNASGVLKTASAKTNPHFVPSNASRVKSDPHARQGHVRVMSPTIEREDELASQGGRLLPKELRDQTKISPAAFSQASNWPTPFPARHHGAVETTNSPTTHTRAVSDVDSEGSVTKPYGVAGVLDHRVVPSLHPMVQASRSILVTDAPMTTMSADSAQADARVAGAKSETTAGSWGGQKLFQSIGKTTQTGHDEVNEVQGRVDPSPPVVPRLRYGTSYEDVPVDVVQSHGRGANNHDYSVALGSLGGVMMNRPNVTPQPAEAVLRSTSDGWTATRTPSWLNISQSRDLH